jgi:hypothetical protein
MPILLAQNANLQLNDEGILKEVRQGFKSDTSTRTTYPVSILLLTCTVLGLQQFLHVQRLRSIFLDDEIDFRQRRSLSDNHDRVTWIGYGVESIYESH